MRSNRNYVAVDSIMKEGWIRFVRVEKINNLNGYKTIICAHDLFSLGIIKTQRLGEYKTPQQFSFTIFLDIYETLSNKTTYLVEYRGKNLKHGFRQY